ncbi:hypothetical protein [Gaoshiqia sp. Z1-71]|uniref:hypothetical protein n=1 Tax=Gaoshiqia hydrogeniformans TaxID=3290090 RepID=UPI003BF774D9
MEPNSGNFLQLVAGILVVFLIGYFTGKKASEKKTKKVTSLISEELLQYRDSIPPEQRTAKKRNFNNVDELIKELEENESVKPQNEMK